MKLYTYFRSSAAYRVRIALNLKNLAYDALPKHLAREGGEHLQAEYLALNPQALVPALEEEGAVIGQSLAIIEYLEESFPDPPLLPAGALQRAQVRAMALGIACDIHPLNNLRVLNYLRREFKPDDVAVNAWIQHWIATGFTSLEELIKRHSADGRHCFGNGVTLADVCLVPQVYNARRFKCDLAAFPALTAVAAHLEAMPAFTAAAPENQPDYEA